MSIRIKPYYCSHCGRFKNRLQVCLSDFCEYQGWCKHCGTPLIFTEEVLREIVKNQNKVKALIEAVKESCGKERDEGMDR